MRIGLPCLVLPALLATACGPLVFVIDEDEGSAGNAHHGSAGGQASGQGQAATSGMPCEYRHGQATLSEYDGDNYASSAFSFEYASQDPAVTYNELDVLYEGNQFRVNTVVDDESFLVDLGDVPLAEVPETVDPAGFPVGQFGEHDSIDAVLDHTYFERAVDGSGVLVAAFRVVGLEPGVAVTIEWVRSTDPDKMVVPLDCGL
ncbi:MAG: hypothetical protein HY744_25995 [Deltaproteobacteria bacterium]|nr:hypothetical protein [Deltaproteobacteria bacterium]